MSDNSAIEWTDATWNPVRGCVKVSPGCAHCYAETFAERFRGVQGHPYEQGFDVRLVPEKLSEPLRKKKPTTYFVNSMSDLFQADVPDSYIDRVFAVMALTPQHTYQILTKRAERMHDYMHGRSKTAEFWKTAARESGYALEFRGMSLVPFPLPNVWLGVSVENQHFADERIPELLQTPAAVRFISAEPLLGPIDLHSLDYLDWVIVGGESGHGARLCRVEWIRSILEQCLAAGVPCFVKQLGAHPISALGLGQIRDSKGGDPFEWPEDLRVREFPLRKG